jgi:hypothetical protein
MCAITLPSVKLTGGVQRASTKTSSYSLRSRMRRTRAPNCGSTAASRACKSAMLLEEQSAPERRRRFPDARAHQAVEVKGAEHRPRRQRAPVQALVESLQDGIDDVAQAIRLGLHGVEYAARLAGRA